MSSTFTATETVIFMSTRVATVMRRSVGSVAAALLLTLAVGCSSHSPDGARAFASGVQAPEAPAPPGGPANDATLKADIVTTGTLRMTVASPKDAADKLVAAAGGAGGHVESRSEESGHGSPTVELILRIPSDKVDGVLSDIHELGVVDSMQIGHDDVTAQRVDLDARIKALQTSVDRLLDLMSKAASTSALLEAENSLTQRQSDLDSLRSQRGALGDQIAYSTITVNLATEPEVIAPGGFTGAIKDGWEALVKVGGALAAVVGFILPWLPVFAVFVGVVWLLRRRQLRHRPEVHVPQAQPQPQAPEPTPVAESTD
jgi:Ca-activated chloride channel family protein